MCKIFAKINVFSFIFVMLLTFSFVCVNAEEFKRHMTITGQASVAAPPDRVEINLGVKSKANTARDALALNNANMSSIIDVLKGNGVLSKNIQTSNFSIQPEYERIRNGRTPKITGYSVTNTVRINIEDIGKLGELLDKVVKSGSNQIYGIRFYVSNADELRDAARKKAFQNAMRKAKIYAEAAGVTLGKTISIVEGSLRRPPPGPLARTINAEAVSVPIAGGQQQLQVNVTVVWALQ